MRPLLLPALRGLWRDGTTWQIGVEPGRAVQLAEADRTTVRMLSSLDGSRDLDRVCADAEALGIQEAAIRDLVLQLQRLGVVVDAATRTHAAGQHAGRRRRLVGDALALSLRVSDPERVLLARADRAVVVHGGGRLALPIAAHLAAAGIGRVHVRTSGTVLATEIAPGGAHATDEHRPRATVAVEAIHRVAPEADTQPLPAERLPDLVVLTEGPCVPLELLAQLNHRAVPHLMVGVREDRGTVGPLVVPGSSACLRCADLHRTDRDPAWPLLLAQQTGEAERVLPHDTSLAAAVVALAGAQALCHLDGGECDAMEGSLELLLPGYRVRRRSFPPHPECRCRGDQALQSVG